jgi:imidazolonepropionase-like amidohydrolase
MIAALHGRDYASGYTPEMLCRLLFTFTLLLRLLAAQDRIVLETSTIIDGKGAVVKGQRISIKGSRIESVGKSSGPATYDLRGLTVMPGWIDTHVHLDWHFDATHHITDRSKESRETLVLFTAENAWITLLGGFTTVQSVGAPTDALVRDRINLGLLPGPRILTSLTPVNPQTGTPDAIREHIRRLKADGADLVKIFAATNTVMTDAQMEAAVSEAHAQGLRTVTHARFLPEEKVAVRAGVTTIEHGYGLDDDTLESMAKRGIYFDPNFLVSHNYIENVEAYRRPGSEVTTREKLLATLAEVIVRARRHNVKIVLGTDAVAGAHGRNAEEFIYRVHDGHERNMDVILSGTSVAAESLGMADRIGSIAPGMEADVIATEGNPLEDITAVRRVVFVMKGGRVYKNIARSQH